MGFINMKRERTFTADMIEKLHVRLSSMEQAVESLSGGNQQKIVIAKWLARDPALLILDEPTRGIDVGAKREIYDLMNEMKSEGRAILMISSDLPELLGICDRIYVMHEGKTMGELEGESMNESNFIKLATGRDLAWIG